MFFLVCFYFFLIIWYFFAPLIKLVQSMLLDVISVNKYFTFCNVSFWNVVCVHQLSSLHVII